MRYATNGSPCAARVSRITESHRHPVARRQNRCSSTRSGRLLARARGVYRRQGNMATTTVAGSTVTFSNSGAAADLSAQTSEDSLLAKFDISTILASSGGGAKTVL